ncbi:MULTISPECIES: GAF domain-containing sensor histidine kinase [Paenibacillus]|uniref:GAF domain-containing sensor histidine kinase n=1 Tax=Paenibacillus TaxID=44249 RepID=UPI0022B905FA|nr:GAF domain-containing sensor histidine kinase [Paenibacillus caseinilyticus]MCZ8521438.1 GAF domain-containing sensor histidine kinase [Paenibacillus caseinilyticus]
MKPTIVYSSWEDEKQRLQELKELDIVGTGPEESFDRITKLVAQVFGVPGCLITLITEDRQWFKSCIGLPDVLKEARSTERENTICQYVVATKKALVVEDTRLDPRFRDNPVVTESDFRFYAGAPLVSSQGNVLGTLCISDSEPRTFTAVQVGQLCDFAAWVMTEIELRRDLRDKEVLTRELLKEKQTIEAQRDLIRSAFDEPFEGKLLCDSSGHILLHNKSLLESFLVNPALHKDVLSFVDSLLRVCQVENSPLPGKILSLLEGREASFLERFTSRMAGEERKDFQVSGILAEGEEPGKRLVYLNIRERTEEERIDRMKSEFISVVSHELRTPLTSIMGFVEILLDRRPAEDKRMRYLETIHREAERLTQLLNDLLDLQKMESGKQQYMFEIVDLNALVEEVADSWRDHPTHRLQIRCPEQSVHALADGDRMKQALHNLVSNAFKYSPGKDLVEVTLEERDGMACIRVKDEGLGIPPEAAEKLFSKFYRVDNSDRRKIGGTGLGLAIVREIMTAHGGLVEFEASPGGGTVFLLRLEALQGLSPAK